MYVTLVLAQTVVLPIASAAIELVVSGGDPILVTGRWFLFWGVGSRLLVAGLSQVVRPAFTAQRILGNAGDGANQVVQELGFSNLVVGLVALIAASLVRDWTVPIAIVGGGFLGLAGLRHVAKPNLERNELVATWTDLLVAVAMVILVARSVWP